MRAQVGRQVLQKKQLEDVQRRALQIIFGNIPYDEARRSLHVTFCH